MLPLAAVEVAGLRLVAEVVRTPVAVVEDTTETAREFVRNCRAIVEKNLTQIPA